MTKKIHLKSQSLYIGCYDFGDGNWSNWHSFAYTSNASDEELEKHFREVVYMDEYGEMLGGDARVDVYELREAHDYSTGEDYKVTVHDN